MEGKISEQGLRSSTYRDAQTSDPFIVSNSAGLLGEQECLKT